MKRISVTIEGSVPMLMHKFTDKAQADATNGTRVSTSGEMGTPREQAEEVLYVHEGKVIIPAANIFSCLIEAGKFFKNGKSKLTTNKTSLLPAALTLPEIYIDLEHKDPWEVDSRPVRIPSTGGRILRHRPLFNDWKLTWEMELDESIISTKQLREVVDMAGRAIGLGDFRPACKGFFGKFKVTNWKVENAE